MNNVKLIIFDLDGTLLDTGRGILKCIVSTLEKMGFQIPDEETCKSFIGPPLKKRFQELFNTDNATADDFVTKFREDYGKGDIFLADRYEGMNECLEYLHKHYSLAVATNKREDLAIKLLEKFGMASHFKAIYGSCDLIATTKKQILEKTAEQQSVPFLQCLVIGDSSNDADAATELGMKFIGVTYGYGFTCETDLSPYPYVASIKSPKDLKRIIKEKENELS